MTIWEYKIVNIEKMFFLSNAEIELEKLFNSMGKQGWELVGYITFKARLITFKRIKQQEKE